MQTESSSSIGGRWSGLIRTIGCSRPARRIVSCGRRRQRSSKTGPLRHCNRRWSMPEPSERRPSVRRPTVALIVDHPQRDLAGIVLTGVQLCQQGVICHLVPHNLEDRELWALAPDLVLLNFFRPANEGLARKLMTAGIQVAVLDTEGGVWPTEEAYVELLWQDAKLRRQLECVCMWGPRLARHLVAREVLSSEQVVVTGCPRFDFYHPQWQPVMHQAGARSPA